MGLNLVLEVVRRFAVLVGVRDVGLATLSLPPKLLDVVQFRVADAALRHHARASDEAVQTDHRLVCVGVDPQVLLDRVPGVLGSGCGGTQQKTVDKQKRNCEKYIDRGI